VRRKRGGRADGDSGNEPVGRKANIVPYLVRGIQLRTSINWYHRPGRGMATSTQLFEANTDARFLGMK